MTCRNGTCAGGLATVLFGGANRCWINLAEIRVYGNEFCAYDSWNSLEMQNPQCYPYLVANEVRGRRLWSVDFQGQELGAIYQEKSVATTSEWDTCESDASWIVDPRPVYRSWTHNERETLNFYQLHLFSSWNNTMVAIYICWNRPSPDHQNHPPEGR